MRENVGNAALGARGNERVEVVKRQAQSLAEQCANGGFAGPHKAYEGDFIGG